MLTTTIGEAWKLKPGDSTIRMGLLLLMANPEISRKSRQNTALYLAIDCPEMHAPWDKLAGFEERRRQLLAAVKAVPEDRFAPFTPEEWAFRPALLNQYQECIHWPGPPRDQPTEIRHEQGEWDPDILVLVINGALDMNTPDEDAQLCADQFPNAQFARLNNHGHVVIPASMCAAGLWFEFIGNKEIENPLACLDADPKTLVIRPPAQDH